MKPKGIREPHWHPNAAELDYVISGRARMTIFSPGDNVDTFEVGPGEIVFIPSAYFHYIENVNASEDMQFAVFFNHERPEDIGISGALGAYSNDVLGSVFGLEPKILDALPKYQEDLFVVSGGMTNTVSPVAFFGLVLTQQPSQYLGHGFDLSANVEHE